MFNLPVKLSVMSALYDAVSAQVFLGKSHEDSMYQYKQILPEKIRQTLEFAYSDRAILLILEKEFEVQVARRQMVFTKPDLDANSWLFANGYDQCPDITEVEEAIDYLTELLWIETAACSQENETLQDRLELRREIKVLLALYYVKFADQQVEALASLLNQDGMKRFLTLVIADAVYKADGACVLFGRDSAYHKLWIKKQHQFYAYSEIFTRHFQLISHPIAS